MSGAAAGRPGTAGAPRVVHVEHCMGTVFSIDIRDPGSWDAAIAEVTRWLHHVDEVFSTYRPGSDISRLRRGELAIGQASPLVAEVLGLCARAEQETGGYFTTALPGGTDPTGLVKGWAIERASAILRAHGSDNHCVNGGGDIQAAGEASPGQPWRIGISDPLDRSRVLTVVAGRDIAVATSGVAERGLHIVNPRTGAAAAGLASVTVVSGSLTIADAYATAAFAMGGDAMAWASGMPGIEALLVGRDGATSATPGFGELTGSATDRRSFPGRAGR
jgi:thiamine biosynthesis lipoprotein